MADAGENDKVIRPALPLLLGPLVGIWAGLFLAEALVWKAIAFSEPTLIAMSLISGLALLAVVIGRGLSVLKLFLSLATSLVLGLSVGMLYWAGIDKTAEDLVEALSSHGSQEFAIRIVEDPQQGALSQTSVAVVKIPGSRDLRVRIYWKNDQDPLPLGSEFLAKVSFKPLNEQQSFLHQKGITGSVSLSDIRQEVFTQSILGKIYSFREQNRQLLQAMEGEGAALLRGVLLGDTTDLNSSEAGKAYKTTGLSHLIAVSGSHLVVIASLISWFIKKLKVSRSLELVLIVSLLVAYVILTGLQASAIRACLMTLISRLAPLAGRRKHVPSALATAGVGMMLAFPPAAFSVGFWLSMFAVFGLTVFCPLVSGYLSAFLPASAEKKSGRMVKGLRKVAFEPLSLTITAQLTTVCITAPLFSTISLVSPLANLLVTPLVTVLVGLGIVTLCLMPLLGPLGMFLIGCLSHVADLSILIARFCASLPYACLPVALDLTSSVLIFLVLAALVYLIWPQPSKRRSRGLAVSTLLLSLVLAMTAFFPVKPQLVMLDIGQGDAILIRDGTTNLLIDTGRSDTLLLKALARQRVSHIDAVIITHLDDDHYGALSALDGTIRVEHVYFAEGLIESNGDSTIMLMAKSLLASKSPEVLAYEDTLFLSQHISLQVIWPEHPVSKGDNEDSLCLYLMYDFDGDSVPEFSVLLTGDAESSVLDQIMKEPENEHFDVYKVGHHGSKKSATESQIKRMGCVVALISVGKNNRYGHPSPLVIEYLESAGVAVYRTDLNGDILLKFEAQRLIVRCDTMNYELNSS